MMMMIFFIVFIFYAVLSYQRYISFFSDFTTIQEGGFQVVNKYGIVHFLTSECSVPADVHVGCLKDFFTPSVVDEEFQGLYTGTSTKTMSLLPSPFGEKMFGTQIT